MGGTVYGMPVVSFLRAQKMQCAAQVLIHTQRSIQDIAAEYGYENEGKFSTAFKGDSPSVYRKEHSKIKIGQGVPFWATVVCFLVESSQAWAL